jgi:hypothetical protein
VFSGSFSARCLGVIGGLLCVLAFAGVVADRGVAGCSNAAFAGFHGYLAGCGAYERVTPAFKAGSPANVRAISSDGSQALIVLTGLFAGVEGDSKSAYYHSVRSAVGWSTSAIDPSSLLFPAQELVDVSADLSRSLWEVRRSSESIEAQDLAVREADGSFVEVGAMVPPVDAEGPPADEAQLFGHTSEFVYAGATGDLSHVFFQTKGNGPLWRGDTTQAISPVRSLYEYVGTGNAQPELVGLDGEGRLISDCGTALGSTGSVGSASFDSYNAISADGETVYFTAVAEGNCEGGGHAPPVNEVYARIRVGAGAHTVAISEPSGADCEVCQTGTMAPGEFTGASQDGSKVFFGTEQELFKEDTTMNLYEYDFHNRPGHKVVRVSIGSKEPMVQGVARVSEDGSHVYFVARGTLTEGPNAEGDEPVLGGENLYVFERDAAYHTGRVSFVATLSPNDSSSFEGDWSARDSRAVQATPDGRYLVFQSQADLTAGDASKATQVFEYDAVREELVRVSVGQPGYAPGMESADAHASSIPRQEYTQATLAPTQTTRLAVSGDGSVVVFESTGALTEQAQAAGGAGRVSVYEYRSSGALASGRVFSVSNGSGLFPARAIGTDAAGTDAFFSTVVPVLATDGDTQLDMYDARDGGGFPIPSPVPDCAHERLCHGLAGAAPTFTGAESLLAPGAEPAPAPSIERVVKPVALTRAQKLARALKACGRVRRRHRRRVCEASARRRYASHATAKRKG